MNEPQTISQPPQPVPEPQSRSTERIVGIFVLIAVVLLVVGFGYYIYNTAERKGWHVRRALYFTRLNSAEGLNVGDPVFMMGFNVGEITAISEESPGSDKPVFIAFEIRAPHYGYIWSDSKLRIEGAGFLGARRLVVTAGVAGKPTVYEEHGRISAMLFEGNPKPIAQLQKGILLEPDEQASLSERAEKLLGQVEVALPNILAITNRLNVVLDNSAVLVSNSNLLVANLNQTTLQLQPVVSNATIITANLRDPHGSLGEWLIPTDMHTNLDETIITLSKGLGDTLNNLALITSNLNTQVQTNDQMLTGISKLVIDTDNLVQGLKKHWLLRGIFAKENSATNKPGLKAAEPKK